MRLRVATLVGTQDDIPELTLAQHTRGDGTDTVPHTAHAPQAIDALIPGVVPARVRPAPPPVQTAAILPRMRIAVHVRYVVTVPRLSTVLPLRLLLHYAHAGC